MLHNTTHSPQSVRASLSRYFLAIATFCMLFFTINGIGYFGVQVLLQYIERVYIKLQLDVNQRQAEFMVRFITDRLKAGKDSAAVVRDVQSSIEGTEYDRGYTCVINTTDTKLLCHPDVELVDVALQDVATRFQGISHTTELSASVDPWSSIIRQGGASGYLQFGEQLDADREIVFMKPIPGTTWVVAAHENSSRLTAEIKTLRTTVIYSALVLGLVIAFPASFFARRISRVYERRIEHEQERSERLLLNIMPQSIATRLKNGEQLIADQYENVAVLFSDLVGFTVLSSRKTPQELLQMLNEIYSAFDTVSGQYGVEKIKTIGDAYMVVGGLPEKDAQGLVHTLRAALGYCSAIDAYRHKYGVELSVRIGIHCGALVAGVIGTKKFSYDVWGDTVNTASRMESHGMPDRIHCSAEVYEQMKTLFEFEDRGEIEVKGKGTLHTYWLLRERILV